MMTRPSPLLVLTSLVASCAPSTGERWFPLVQGFEQTYAVTIDSEEQPPPEKWTLRVTGTDQVNGTPVMVRHHSAGVSYYLREDDTGIRRLATRTDIDAEPTPDKEPLWVLKAPYAVGTEWSTPTVPYLILRRNEHPRELRYSHRALMGWRIEADNDTVTTPAGTFSPCLRVVGRAELSLYTDPVNGFSNVPLTSREWYCKGHGLVKFEREEPVPRGFLVGATLRAELLP